MINEKLVKQYCKEDISLIENYEIAISDNTQTWHCHHRDEVKVLPSGMRVIRLSQDLIEAGRYYNCPANELIFLTNSEHRRLHNTGEGNPNYSKKLSEEHRGNISTALQGKKFSEEHKSKLSIVRKGFVAKSIEEHYSKPISDIPKIYRNERDYYYRHKKFRWEMEENHGQENM